MVLLEEDILGSSSQDCEQKEKINKRWCGLADIPLLCGRESSIPWARYLRHARDESTSPPNLEEILEEWAAQDMSQTPSNTKANGVNDPE